MPEHNNLMESRGEIMKLVANSGRKDVVHIDIVKLARNGRLMSAKLLVEEATISKVVETIAAAIRNCKPK